MKNKKNFTFLEYKVLKSSIVWEKNVDMEDELLKRRSDTGESCGGTEDNPKVMPIGFFFNFEINLLTIILI